MVKDQMFNQLKKIPKEKVLIVMALQIESENILEKSGFMIYYTGAGLLNSMYSLTYKLSQIKPDRVINLGTAGSYIWPVGSFVEIEKCVQRGQVFSKIKRDITLTTISNFPKVTCGSADFIHEKPDSNFGVMDMECYSLAYVCQKQKIPFHSFKFVTDGSGQNTETEWKSNLKKAQECFLKFCHSLNEES